MDYKDKLEKLDNMVKLVRNIFFIGAILWVGYSSTIGPGIQKGIRDFVGTTELSAQVGFIEEYMIPPRIVNWETQTQLDTCDSEACTARHFISRTPYGSTCGIPTLLAEIRVNGFISNLQFHDFIVAELTERGRSVDVPFAVSTFIPKGSHDYRFIANYPTCSWSKEPIPRISPWFPIEVTDVVS